MTEKKDRPDEDALLDPIRHQAMAGCPMIVLTRGPLVGRVREALAVAGRSAELRDIRYGSSRSILQVDGATRSLPDGGPFPDAGPGPSIPGGPIRKGLRRSIVHPAYNRPLESWSLLPRVDVEEILGGRCVAMVVTEDLDVGEEIALQLMHASVERARSEGRPPPALIHDRNRQSPDRYAAFLADGEALGYERHKLLDVDVEIQVMAPVAWGIETVGLGDLTAAWLERLDAYDRRSAVTVHSNMAILEEAGRRVVVVRNSGTGAPTQVWEILPSGRCRTVALTASHRHALSDLRLATLAMRGGVHRLLDVARNYGERTLTTPVSPFELLIQAEADAGLNASERPSSFVDAPLHIATRSPGQPDLVAQLIEQDPARIRERRDFALTWPAMVELLRSDGIRSVVDGGAETLSPIARALGVNRSIARRLVGLRQLPESCLRPQGEATDTLRLTGMHLSALGHDLLPAAGDAVGWEALNRLSAYFVHLAREGARLDGPTMRRLLVTIPGRDWKERCDRVHALGDPLDVQDMVRSLARWLSVISGHRITYGAAATMTMQHASLLRIAQASRAWHGHGLLRSGDHGLPMDTTWPVPFDPFYLGMGLEAHALGGVRDLIDEGTDGPDSMGRAGLGHCVGGYGQRCQTGESVIVSIRRTAETGGARVSTAELVPSPEGNWNLAGRPYRVNQHRGLRNATPPSEAQQSLGFLRDLIHAKAVPIRADALKPRSPAGTVGDAEHGACFHPAWRRLLPRRYARLSLEELAAGVRPPPDPEAEGPQAPRP